jgi:sensor histidine kinase regulating citrate/malate metabolism
MISGESRSDEYRFEVADDGSGIPDAQKADVLGKGERGLRSGRTGIGLYMVNTVVTAANGTTQILDNDPTGTIVRLQLHRAERQPV